MSGNTNNPPSEISFHQAIIHVDCDAFFTSVEQALRPELKGKPLVTGKERGIVACASYDAKRLGIRRPMRLWEAKRMYPALICLPSNYEAYSIYSKRMFEIMRRFTPVVEEYSIDEAFADLTGLEKIHKKNVEAIARDMKMEIQRELGLTVSIGLSSSRTLAKLASKREKPDGFTVFKLKDLPAILPKIPVDEVCGFGHQLSRRLRAQGVYMIWDYVSRPVGFAKQLIGKIGVELWQELRGIPVYPFVTKDKDDYQSIGKCKTFTPASADKNYIWAQLLRNVESALIKMRRYRLTTDAVIIYLRTQEFTSSGLESSLPRRTASIVDVTPTVQKLFEQLFQEGTRYRLTGIVLLNLRSDGMTQLYFTDDTRRLNTYRALDKVIDEANAHYGKHSLHLGTSLLIKKHAQHVSERGDLPKRKKELLKGETYRRRLGIPIWEISLKN